MTSALVGTAFLGFGERAAEGGDGRMLARVLAGFDGQLRRDPGDGDAAVLQGAGEQERVLVDALRPTAVVGLRGEAHAGREAGG
ncbi:hypothetical protein ACFY12_08840 [Streptomyces sp. NPDC001339]|uniref:hypothetical protein n=1 Tax=Streptomyces sp. NPDC001339 TaxID=3364563 RepID=UPI0036CB15FB